MTSPHLLTFTVMKNEGPFIIEWVAYQRLMGVQTVLVMTNDCDDGTDLILDRLQDLGRVRHLPNPSVLMGDRATRPHLVGIAYGKMLREWREADYIFLSDVDEFPVVRTGDGSLQALLQKTDYPDVISLNETLFGTGGQVEYDTRLVTESFTRRRTLTPAEGQKPRRGLKSITRNIPGVLTIRNHRPTSSRRDAARLHWVDGSGQDFPLEYRHVHEKGIDCRGRADLAYINHYTLRSVESFLVKMARGDAVAPDRINLRYYRQRNANDEDNTEVFAMLPRLKEEIARLMKDPALRDLHHAAVAAHQDKIKAIKKSPDFAAVLKRLNVAPEPAEAKAA